ncbi:cytochrome P450 [Hypoxylon sp. FL1150]|nr:cytochrome P450 [Hypoxylon sp. FL1150]
MANTSLVSFESLRQRFTLVQSSQHEPFYSYFFPYIILLVAVVWSNFYFFKLKTYNAELPIVNLTFGLEPRWFARLRWGLKSRHILSYASQKFQGGAYRLVRGDADIIILPPSMIPELNRLPQNILNSREYHAFSVLGRITGLDVVRKTDHHVRVILSRVSPAMPRLLQPMAHRIASASTRFFPQRRDKWEVIRPLESAGQCVTEGIALALFGQPTCDDPMLIRACFQLATDAFTVVMVLRHLPSWLQPIVGWMLPIQWRLRRTWTEIENLVIPVIRQRQQEGSLSKDLDLLSWMVTDGKLVGETDPRTLSRLAASVAVGGIYSTANIVVGVLADLLSHPEILEEIRAEIREKNEEINGHWNLAALNSLDKLDSVIKETSRLAPGSMLVYSRITQSKHTLSNNVSLRKGQFIAVSGLSRSMDPSLFPDPEVYNGLRHYSNLDDHRARPFSSIDGDILTWGAGRSACPGRFIANGIIKILLVKLLDEFDFRFVESKPLQKVVCHEFVLFHPFNRLMVKRREHDLGIQFE